MTKRRRTGGAVGLFSDGFVRKSVYWGVVWSFLSLLFLQWHAYQFDSRMIDFLSNWISRLMFLPVWLSVNMVSNFILQSTLAGIVGGFLGMIFALLSDVWGRSIHGLSAYHIGAALTVLLFVLLVFPGPLAAYMSSGMGSIMPGCLKCDGQPLYCSEAGDCPNTIKEVFYGEAVTLSEPYCVPEGVDEGRCAYNSAVRWSGGAIACNFVECKRITCTDECDPDEWYGCRGDYMCVDRNLDYCAERIYVSECQYYSYAYPSYRNLIGKIKSVEVKPDTVDAGQDIQVEVMFEAATEGNYMVGASILYPDEPKFTIFKVTRNYCNKDATWMSKEMYHMTPGIHSINITLSSKENKYGTYNMEAAWLKGCSEGSVEARGRDASETRTLTPVMFRKPSSGTVDYRAMPYSVRYN